MTYKETTEYLFECVPMFQNVGGAAYKEGLSNTHVLDEHFGHPHRKYRTIHVGGTNGKGSCCHTLAAILQTAGYKVGLYTSPHLIDFRERIRVNGEMIPEERVIAFVENERAFFEPLAPSFFELTTALAFHHFAEEKVDVAVIEVGMGGRLDCTNIIRPDLSVITNISLDHTQFLGHTLPEIAAEKAGIIKDGIPVVVGETTEETRQVFVNKSLNTNSPITFAEEIHEIVASRIEGGKAFYQTRRHGTLEGELCGACQDKNTATILAAVDVLRERGYAIDEADIREGFSHVCELTGLRGRWEQVGSSPLVVCDTGHNTGGMKYIARQLDAFCGGAVHVVIGMVNDKDIQGVLHMLPRKASYYFTKASVKRAMNEHDLQQMAHDVAGLQGSCYPNVKLAFQAAKEAAAPNDMIFVGGSTFVVADFLALAPTK